MADYSPLAGDEKIAAANRPLPLLSYGLKSIYVMSVALAIPYGICAIQYGFYQTLGPYGPFGDSGPMANSKQWHDELAIPLTSKSYMQGYGSTTSTQRQLYGDYFYFMSPHQIAGGIMMFCGIIQMNGFFRTEGRQKWHRFSGRVYVVAHLINLFGSMGWLIAHTAPGIFPESETQTFAGSYGGSIFLLTLWMYWAVGVVSLTMGVFHIARGEVERHRAWMSLSYVVAIGAPMLRVFWVLYGHFTAYRMSQINEASVIWFVSLGAFCASCYASLSHRQSIGNLRPTIVKPASAILFVYVGMIAVILYNQCCVRFSSGTPDLNFLIPMSNITMTASAANSAALVASAGTAGAFAAAMHVMSWGIALLLGALLLPTMLLKKAPSAKMIIGFVVATALAGISSLSCSGPLSFTFFLHHPEATDSHFYKDLPRAIWDCTAGLMILKAGIFLICTWVGDDARAAEWLLYTYSHLCFYPMFYPCLWFFAAVMPSMCSFQDAYHHAAVTSVLGGQVVFFVVGIYIYQPHSDKLIGAMKNGLFNWRTKNTLT